MSPRIASPPRGEVTTVTYVGHATVLVELDGVRLLTDPLLRRRVAHLRRRAAVNAAAEHGIDAVLVSHAHRDHLDLPSLERLGRATRLVVPRGIGGLLRRRHFGDVVEVDVGERVEVGGLTVHATPAVHDGRRGPFAAKGPALGFVVEGSQRLYFAGDTDLFDEMESLGGSPSLDVAFVPIWGWGATLGRGEHLDPERAAIAVARLRPRIVVPIHWGTYHPMHRGLRGEPGFIRDPPHQFARAVSRLAPGVDVRVVAPGESLALDPRPGAGM